MVAAGDNQYDAAPWPGVTHLFLPWLESRPSLEAGVGPESLGGGNSGPRLVRGPHRSPCGYESSLSGRLGILYGATGRVAPPTRVGTLATLASNRFSDTVSALGISFQPIGSFIKYQASGRAYTALMSRPARLLSPPEADSNLFST